MPANEWKDPALAEHLLVGRIAPGILPGTYNVKVGVILNHQRYEHNVLPMLVKVEGPYTFTPDAITLRKLTMGEVREGVMTLSSSEPIEVKSVSINNKNIQVTHRPGAEANTILFDLVVPEHPELRLQNGDLSVVVNINGKEVTHTIAVTVLLEKMADVPVSNTQ